jgi:type VI secretion system secreted protein VgrG
MKHKFLILFVFAALAALLFTPAPGLATPYLGSAQSFAVLGASTVTNTGPTTIYGEVGLYRGTSITGFPPAVVTGGTIHTTDSVAQQAQIDALTAYNTLKAMQYAFDLTDQDLGGLTLIPGVYYFATTAQLTGVLTLDFATDPGEDFVFQIGTALTTGSGSSVNIINGNSLSGVYWQVGSSATLGTSTVFAGNILADQSITLNTTAKILCGRAIALNAAVTMDTNTISNNNIAEDFGSGRDNDFRSYGYSGGTTAVPEPTTMLLLGSGLVGLVAFRKRFKKA